MKALIVDKAKVRNNLQVIRTAAGDAQIYAVLKINAYGLGLKPMAELCREAGIRRFAVTEPEDAVRLRDWGFQEEEILILRSTACEEDIRAILKAGATATVGSYDAALALNGIAESEGVVCDVHIKVDTGMGRYGFVPGEIDRILSVYRYLGNLNVTGTYTHYANAFRSKKKTQAQYDLFLSVVDKIRAAGFEPGMLHASNSEAFFGCKMPNLDAVRIGSALGGRLISKGDFGLQRTGRLQSEIVEVRWLPKGATIGYGSAYTTRHPPRGLRRRLSGGKDPGKYPPDRLSPGHGLGGQGLFPGQALLCQRGRQARARFGPCGREPHGDRCDRSGMRPRHEGFSGCRAHVRSAHRPPAIY